MKAQLRDRSGSIVRGCNSHLYIVSFQIYCCTGFLSLTGQMHQVNADLLGWWLCERQLQSGGLNGRPEKVCMQTKVGKPSGLN